MQIELLHRPGSTAARVTLDQGESLSAEGGSMIALKGQIHMETNTFTKNQGGFLSGIKRLVAGESFFVNHYTAQSQGAQVYLSTALAGDMEQYTLTEGETLYIQGGAYVCSSQSVKVGVSWQGLKNMFSGEDFFWVKVEGPGTVVFNAFGAVYPIEVDGSYIVDSSHVVAYQETLNFEITKAGSSWLSALLGGEGLVCKFKGRGKVWCQSHNPQSFGGALGPMLKARKE